MNNPQDLYQVVRAGGDAKAFLLYMHRQNSGGLLLDDIKAEEQRKRDHRTEYIRKISLSNQKTVLVPAVSPAKETPSTFFYVDEFDRMCLKMRNADAHTADLVEESVEIFHDRTKAYPVAIVLCPFRAPASHLRHYYHRSGIRIPYTYAISHQLDYDVLLRGLGGVSWIL